MHFRPYDIIATKRDGRAHEREEIDYFIAEYSKGRIPDYQVSAWLMACFLNGLDEQETFYLTDAMLHSGNIVDLSSIKQPKVDKHSTGGVGDKVSLVLAPAAAACGVVVPMTSGRGLGFSGGTLDKLESIPGFNVNLSEKAFVRVLEEVGYAMTGQTDTLAPADRKLYALRDVTGTVENISLITASILSKKVAEGADSIVMDVKTGSGAFIKTLDGSRKLASSLMKTARLLGKRVSCVISSMDQPLGSTVGNSLEVIESVACLRGEGPGDLRELVTLLGGYMLMQARLVDDVEAGVEKIERVLNDGSAFERFMHSVECQGGDVSSIEDTGNLPHARFSEQVYGESTGFVNSMNTELIGVAAIYLGAGRFTKDDRIDPATGITVHRKIGDRVGRRDALVTLHYNDDGDVKKAAELVQHAYTIGPEEPPRFNLILEVCG
jgi:pyrimidine-nucleoside phosphorylase